MPDLHSLLVASLTARLERARAATRVDWDGWVIATSMATDSRLAALIDDHEPELEIRRVEAALRVVQDCVHFIEATAGGDRDEANAAVAQALTDILRDLAAGEGIEVGDG